MQLLKTGVRSLSMLAAGLLIAACDLPTEPRGARDPNGAGPAFDGECQLTVLGKYLCPPQSPDWGDECDPYHFDCGGDDCIMSVPSGDDATMQGCNGGGGGDTGSDGGGDDSGGGGGGGSGGGGGGGPACPDYGCTQPPPSETDDYVDTDTIPDCTKPLLEVWEHAYCTSAPPSGERLARTVNALDRVQSRGGECANIAAFGRQLLANGMIRFYPYIESIHGSYGGWGNPYMGAILDNGWVDDFGGTPLGFPNFDRKLIHEVEHAMGREHIDSTGQETPNSRACAGF